MNYPIRHLPNPPQSLKWPAIAIAIYAGSGLVTFALIAIGFLITGYVLLWIDRRLALPAVLEVTSTSEDGEIMGVRHRELAGTATPLEGVQFHPESILTEHGHAMLKNFLTRP